MSGYIPAIHRRQRILLPETLDDYLTEENPVRFLDAFVDRLDLRELEITHAELNTTGRPPYDPAALLKLYLYGYLYGVRSSRRLERECRRNLEVMWLLRKLTPDFKTIADFRRDNVDHIRPLFQRLVALCRELRLLEGDLVAIDGSKFRAVNSRDRNYNRAKLADRMKSMEKSIDRYLRELDENDAKEAENPGLPASVPNLKEKIERMKERQRRYRGLLAQLEATGATEISLTDPDSRMMKGNNDRMEVAYNTQIAVEATSKLIVAYDLDNHPSDHHQLAAMSQQAQAALDKKALRAVADRGYYDGEQVRRCVEQGVTPYVPEPEKAKGSGERAGMSPEFYKERFVYDSISDTIVCPAGHRMTPSPVIRKGWRQRPEGVALRVFRTNRCHTCPHFMTRCTHSPFGRRIQRTENEEFLEAMRGRLRSSEGERMLTVRQSVVEHPFGTIKRAFDQGYLLLKGLRKVRGEIGFTMIAYDLRRLLSLVGTRGLVARLSVERRQGRARPA